MRKHQKQKYILQTTRKLGHDSSVYDMRCWFLIVSSSKSRDKVQKCPETTSLNIAKCLFNSWNLHLTHLGWFVCLFCHRFCEFIFNQTLIVGPPKRHCAVCLLGGPLIVVTCFVLEKSENKTCFQKMLCRC